MASERPRIFLGTSDTASCLSALAHGFRENGCAVTTMVTHREPYAPETRHDIVRGRELLMRYEYEAAPRPVRGIARRLDTALSIALNTAAAPAYLHEHDVFVFIVEPWAPAPTLFPLMRRLGKKIIVYYLGSDARHVSAISQEYGIDTSTWGPGFNRDPIDPKVQRIRWGELYADLVYSVPDQSGLQIRPYYHAHVPVQADLVTNIRGRVVPKVVHAPSRLDLKGTSFVVQAVEQLRSEGLKFDFQLLSGIKRRQVLEAVADSDIVVDELILHGPGVLSAEAMFAGCAVATRIIDPPHPFFSPPVSPVTPATITASLRRLIEDVPYRTDLAARGAVWARAAFDPKQIAARVLRHLEGEELPQYVPRFYLDEYRPPHPLSRLSLALSLRVAERFRPEATPMLYDAARRGVTARPPYRRRLGTTGPHRSRP